VVSDGEVCVIWLQSVLRAPEQHSHVLGVVQPDVEVCVVADLHWEVHKAF
jgi:hypothetical protein